ncbi:MAG TPA: ABC-three component system protein [Nitrospira sp.]|nr:ABC-three component system protein [Nitrospira sp.]
MSLSGGSFSAAEQGLGYIYQGRFALLRILELPENTGVLIEKNDDVEFISEGGAISLASLKHKAPGDTLTDLSTDFWKSVRIWLKYYLDNGRISADVRFFLFTTATISAGSFLVQFASQPWDPEERARAAQAALETSQSQIITAIKVELNQLDEKERVDFYSRITIVDDAVRIANIPSQINQHLRTVRREAREALFQRLEGWWTDQVIKILTGHRNAPIYGYEVSDKLSALAEEYRSDNLPITFRNRLPDGKIDAANDPRIFVEQVRFLDLSATRIRNAIIDYYRAFEQRSSWARENLLVSGEIEEYEDRLVDEWVRYREVVFEDIDESSAAEVCLQAGRELYRWAEMETSMLRIRERVTEPYVVRGTFHILANMRPSPRVYWHPRFFQRLAELLGVAA